MNIRRSATSSRSFLTMTPVTRSLGLVVAFVVLLSADGAAFAQLTPVNSITTIAGNGTRGLTGDGGPGTSAEVNDPFAVILDPAGNLYIADTGNNVVRKLATDGTITTVAGNGTQGFSGDGGLATQAMLNDPEGLGLDSAGNLYIADLNNQRIREVSAATGIITTVAGNGNYGFSGDGGPAVSAQLYNPYDVKVDSTGNLYIADETNSRIRKVTAAGIITTIAGNGTVGNSGDGGTLNQRRHCDPGRPSARQGRQLVFRRFRRTRRTQNFYRRHHHHPCRKWNAGIFRR